MVRSTGNFSFASGLFTLTWNCKDRYQTKGWKIQWQFSPEIYVVQDQPQEQRFGSPAPQTWGRTQPTWTPWRCGCRWSFWSRPWSASQSARLCPYFRWPLVLCELNSQETAQCDFFTFRLKRHNMKVFHQKSIKLIRWLFPCKKRRKIASQLTRGPSWATLSPTRKSPTKSMRACRPIFVNCSQAHSSSHRPPAICSLQPAAPDARSAVFWRDPRKPQAAWHSLPSCSSWVGVRGLRQ